MSEMDGNRKGDNALSKYIGWKSEARDGGKAWVVVFAALVLNIINEGCSSSFGILFVEINEEFDATNSNTAWTGSLFFSMPLLLAPVASKITDKCGSRKATIYGGLIATAGFAIGSFSSSISMLVLSYGLLGGIGMSLPYYNTYKIVTDYFDKRLALASGISESGAGIGPFLFAPISEFLVITYGWRGTMLVLSGVVLNTIVCGALFYPYHNNHKNYNCIAWCKQSRTGRKYTLSNSNELKDKGKQYVFKSMLINFRKGIGINLTKLELRKTGMFILLNFVMCFCYESSYIFLVSKAINDGISFKKASYLLSILGLFHFFGIIGYGVLCNHKRGRIMVVYGTSTFCCGVSVLLFPVFQDFVPLGILAGSAGMFAAASVSLFANVSIRLLGKEQFDSLFCPLVLFISGVANLTGPPLAGFLVDKTGSHNLMYYTAGCCISATSCLFLVFTRDRKMFEEEIIVKEGKFSVENGVTVLTEQGTTENRVIHHM